MVRVSGELPGGRNSMSAPVGNAEFPAHGAAKIAGGRVHEEALPKPKLQRVRH